MKHHYLYAILCGLGLFCCASIGVSQPARSTCGTSPAAGMVLSVSGVGSLSVFRDGSRGQQVLRPTQLICPRDRLRNTGRGPAQVQIAATGQSESILPNMTFDVPVPTRATIWSNSLDLFMQRFRADQTRTAGLATGRTSNLPSFGFPINARDTAIIFRDDLGTRLQIPVSNAVIDSVEVIITNEFGEIAAKGSNAGHAAITSLPLDLTNGKYGVVLRAVAAPLKVLGTFELDIKPSSSPIPPLLRALGDTAIQDDMRAIYQACDQPGTLTLNALNLSLKRAENGVDQAVVTRAILVYSQPQPSTGVAPKTQHQFCAAR